MKHKSALAIMCITVILAMLTLPFASAITVPTQGVYLPYENGTTVFLPSGTYSSINRTNNVWYVNGVVYPQDLSLSRNDLVLMVVFFVFVLLAFIGFAQITFGVWLLVASYQHSLKDKKGEK